MTSNIDRPGVAHIAAAEYQRLALQQGLGGDLPATGSQGAGAGPRRPVNPAGPKGRSRKKSTSTVPPAARKRAQRLMVPAPDLPPAAEMSRGPWIVEVSHLGRPMTMNDERASAMHPGTMAAVRADKRAWQGAFVDMIRHVGIPPQRRVMVIHQLYYPTNVVPDPDAFGPSHKAVHDSLIEAGVLPNDKRKDLPFGYWPLPPVTDGGPPRMSFTIFPLPVD